MYETFCSVRVRLCEGTRDRNDGVVNGVDVLVKGDMATPSRGGVNTGVCAGGSVGDETAAGRVIVAHAPDLPAPLPLDLCFSVSPNCCGIKMGKA